MSEFFINIVNMSISASWIVLAVLLLRLLLKKAPKWITVLLWGIVAIRLICPFSIESVMSLIPSAETISPEIMMDRNPEINSGVPIINDIVNPIINESFTGNPIINESSAPDPATSANPLQLWILALAVIWLVGMIGLVLYTIISYVRVKRKIGTAVLLRDNIFQSETVISPFVLGIIKPKIYLPFHMSEQDVEHVIAHEQAHINRKDHWWKPLGFLILTVHWFNPLMWLGYVLLCRDIELACDEKAIKELNTEQKADYLQALLTCSVNRRMIAACPLAFGEVGVKDRVKSILNYKKPAFWIVVVAIIASVAVAVCFLTNPTSNKVKDIENGNLNAVTEETVAVRVPDGENNHTQTQTATNEPSVVPTTITEVPTVPAATTQVPSATTKAPTVTTQAPSATTEAPTVTQAPSATTKAPTATTQTPTATTKAPTTTTQAPTTTPQKQLPYSSQTELFKYSVSGAGEVTIYKYIGKTPNVTVPENIDGYKVTSIGWEAFRDCMSVSSVNIPTGVTSIGNAAFSGCANLVSINIPNGITVIGNNIFSDCTALRSITIPDGVTSIGEYAFSSCTSLGSVTIPNSVKSIGSGAFHSCISLGSVTIPNGVTSIGDRAFALCSSLSSVNLPNSVTSLGIYTFSHCAPLSSINMPKSITTIGWGAFEECTALKDVWYEGSESEQANISIDGCNDPLTSANWHHNS